MWLLIVVALMHLGIVSWMLGPRSGATAYLLATPFIATLLVRAGDRSTVWPVAGTASAILVVVSFWAPEGSFEALPPLAQRLLFFVNIAGAIVLASIISLFFRSLIERAEMKLRSEKARGDRLLRAILPDSIAERLKENPEQTVADRCSGATVLLADIVGFTQRSARLDPGRVVADLNRVFSHADEMAAARGVERIKTIGDGYLAVCGLPDPLPDPQARLAGFALDLRDHMSAFAQTFWPDLQFRTVIHAGPVVAGVIGRTKFAYDVWGDTVNTAARLEEVCEPGEILITEPVRAGLPERFIVGAPRRLNLRDKGEFTVFPLVGHR